MIRNLHHLDVLREQSPLRALPPRDHGPHARPGGIRYHLRKTAPTSHLQHSGQSQSGAMPAFYYIYHNMYIIYCYICKKIHI